MPKDPDDMVERVSWFTPAHYEILLFFEDHDIMISPRDLAANIEYHRQYLSARLRELRDVGLLAQDGQLYLLSEDGRAFIQGDGDPDEIEARDPTS